MRPVIRKLLIGAAALGISGGALLASTTGASAAPTADVPPPQPHTITWCAQGDYPVHLVIKTSADDAGIASNEAQPGECVRGDTQDFEAQAIGNGSPVIVEIVGAGITITHTCAPPTPSSQFCPLRADLHYTTDGKNGFSSGIVITASGFPETKAGLPGSQLTAIADPVGTPF
jgi:hypothetical protein